MSSKADVEEMFKGTTEAYCETNDTKKIKRHIPFTQSSSNFVIKVEDNDNHTIATMEIEGRISDLDDCNCIDNLHSEIGGMLVMALHLGAINSQEYSDFLRKTMNKIREINVINR